MTFFIQGKNVHKTSQNWYIFVMFGRFRQNMFISEGSQNPKNQGNPRFWPPSEMNIFRQKWPTTTKTNQFLQVLWAFFPPNRKYQNKNPFWSFFSFSLLSYIEIYIEYRETSSGVMWEPLRGSKKLRKIFFVLFGPYRS